MEKYLIEESTLVDIADQVRALTGTTSPLNPSEMALKIKEMASAGDGGNYASTDVTIAYDGDDRTITLYYINMDLEEVETSVDFTVGSSFNFEAKRGFFRIFSASGLPNISFTAGFADTSEVITNDFGESMVFFSTEGELNLTFY